LLVLLVRNGTLDYSEMVIGEPSPGCRGAADAPVLLVVEDEWLIRMSVVDAFRAAGWIVLEAAGGAEAVALVGGDGRIDLVLTDMRMPGPVDGLGVLASVRAARPEVPVVLVSGHLDPGVALAAGAAAVLAKPYGLDEMVEVVGALYRGGQAHAG
jgi:CheY-like chemotaxis protein